MPPKKPITTAKAPIKSTAKPAAKPAAKPGAKATPAKSGGKPQAKAAEKKEAAPPPPPPITYFEIVIKELDSKVVWDKEGNIKATGKWPFVIDENGLTPRFLRHRDCNMLTTADDNDMQPGKIKQALLGALKFGKPFVLDMMETETYQVIRDKFEEIHAGLLDMVLDKSILKDEKYMCIVKPADGSEFQNPYDYNIEGFSFLITTQITEANEELLRKTFPVKVNN